ncbi:MAG: SAM-dependent methyltransferase [Verrucomicrobiales bacterium]|nr:SAM-dependent methyltransferase [Verrucomicrobiales bacterium]
MDLPALIETLGYQKSGNFLRRGTPAFERAPDIGHILRTAALRKTCRLEGVYSLRPFTDEGSPVPVVYVCEADDVATADTIHRLVWNQDIVPFVLIRTPSGLRLYCGFMCNDTDAGAHEGILEPLIEFDDIEDKLAEFRADAIDSGELWRKRGNDVQPDKRVYWSLLENLKQLAKKFRDQFGRDNVKSIIHPLIGKYVYLHYLKDRGFLSPRRLEEWEIQHDSVFGRTATLAGMRSVCKKLDGFLNGRVFPLKLAGPNAPTKDQIQRIAGAFAGDTFAGEWQFHLPFTAFKFDFIPIETLSMIYEQFLHLPDKPDSDEDDEHSEGRKAGAYYTPVPVVNYMLAEMDKRRPLKRGVRVFDPSCGSGAFLVQCYRRLIEREFTHRKKKAAPRELATLLKRHIFGVDMDENACSVAEFSLYLTLLDYVEPADLVDHPRFRLPTLRKQNIFCTDFFSFQSFKRQRFHWAVGNPPWKKLIPGKIEKRDQRAMAWMRVHSKKMPIGDNSLAQAFAWRCREFMVADGECGLLLPAMTLFEDFSEGFRRAFFREHRLHAVTNFSNMTEMLFAKRSRAPAAACFFGCRTKDVEPDDLEMTTVFSPLVANQEATRIQAAGARRETWSITVNGDEVRELPYCDIAGGSGLPWKLATWGSGLDGSLLGRMRKVWPPLESIEAIWHSRKKEFVISKPEQIVKVSEGLQIRRKGTTDDVERVSEIVEAPVVDVVSLARFRRVFAFPPSSTPALLKGKEYALKGRVKRPLTVCNPPHIIVSAARNFAVYSEKFIVVPPRQIGIVSVDDNRPLLKALALYLSSDFAYYHQFLTSTELGVKRDRATLESLRQIPIPLLKLTPDQLGEWEALHDRLTHTKPRLLPDSKQPDAELDESPADDGQDGMLEELNRRVFDALGLDEAERVLVEDLVRIRVALNDGKVGRDAMNSATKKELQTYGEWLQREFDGQSDGEPHSVTVLHDDRSGFVAIEPAKESASVRVVQADAESARTLARTREQLREEYAQWVYFDRSLRLHRREKTYFFKPIQRIHWTRTRAMLDAADVLIGSMGEGPPR